MSLSNASVDITADIDIMWDNLPLDSRPTIEMKAIPFCRYSGVKLVNSEGDIFVGDVVSYLSLEAWCLAHAYIIIEGGITFYCDPRHQTNLAPLS